MKRLFVTTNFESMCACAKNSEHDFKTKITTFQNGKKLDLQNSIICLNKSGTLVDVNYAAIVLIYDLAEIPGGIAVTNEDWILHHRNRQNSNTIKAFENRKIDSVHQSNNDSKFRYVFHTLLQGSDEDKFQKLVDYFDIDGKILTKEKIDFLNSIYNGNTNVLIPEKLKGKFDETLYSPLKEYSYNKDLDRPDTQAYHDATEDIKDKHDEMRESLKTLRDAVLKIID